MSSVYPFLLAGGLGGLASSLAYSVLWSIVEWWRPHLAEVWSGGRSLGLVGVLLHYLGGTVLGVLFWSSWGLAALVDVLWWERALLFGLLSWCSLSVPSILTTVLAREVPWQTSIAVLTQWACTCALTSFACAWSWETALQAL